MLLAGLGWAVFLDERVATLAVWIGALDLVSFGFSQLLLSETLFTSVLVAATLAGVRACRHC